LVQAHNLAQPPANPIPLDGSACAPWRDEPEPRGPFALDRKHAERDQLPALHRSFGLHPRELGGTREPLPFPKRQPRRTAVRLHRDVTCTAKIFPRTRQGKILQGNFGYFDDGVALVELVVVVSVVVLVAEPGVDAGLELVPVVVDVLELLEEPPPAGEGFTTVVLFSVLLPGDAAGVAVSVFCSHAARSAALARMQMYFFIGFGCSCPSWVKA
jgi:hypothetical protein